MGPVFAAGYFLKTVAALPEVLAARSLGPVDMRVRENFSVRSHGSSFEFLAYALPVVREIHLHGCYGFDPAKRYGVVVDLGANSGTFSVLAAKSAERVIAVECGRSDLKKLFDVTMHLNGVTNAVFINKAVAASDGDGRISMRRLILDYAPDGVDFLKVDIEGAESELFGRKPKWLYQVKQISMEVHPCFGADVGHIKNTLENNGFAVTFFAKDLRKVNGLGTGAMGYVRAVRL